MITSTSVIGETIGSYRVIKQLGAGAMGEVYLAEHRHLKREAAVKLLARELVGRPDLLERFFLEARATSAIHHPGIVQVFDCELDATGRPYIVMEYLTGHTLAGRLAASGALPPSAVAKLVCAMAEALEAAHAKGIVHRDLKPDNIFVDASPAHPVKLVDFGIAKLAGDFRAGQVHQTRSGSLIGTPLYMSPEQCRDSAAVDFRTDLYSLGCVMFEMLTGHPPFTHHGLGELMVAHLNEQPKDVRAVNPAIPAPLAELCGMLLRKDPAARPASMREVANQLNDFIAHATTVPPAAVASTEFFAPPKPVKTTFGDSASEMFSPDEASFSNAHSRRNRIVVGAGVIVLALGATAAALMRGQSPLPAPSTAAAVAAAHPQLPTPPSPPHPGALAVAAPAVPARDDARPPSHLPLPMASKEKVVRPVRGKKSGAPPVVVASVGAPEPRPTPSSSSSSSPSPPSPSPSPSVLPPAVAPSPAVAAAAADRARSGDLTGTWEGPWADPAKQQKGRLYLQIGSDGAVSGWMFNRAAKQSFRLGGKTAPTGELDLFCRCPVNETFVARGTIHPRTDGELVGQLSLSTEAGIFGQSQFTLRRAAAR